MSERAATVIVGRVLGPHGVRGEVGVEPMTDVPSRFEVGSLLRVSPVDAPGRPQRELCVSACRRHRGALLVQFAEIGDRESAAQLRGCWLEVDRGAVPELPAGEYWYFELVGCHCIDRREGDLGEVVDVVEDGGGLLLEVESEAGRLLVPFVEAYVERVDPARRRIDLELPEGLVETCRSRS